MKNTTKQSIRAYLRELKNFSRFGCLEEAVIELNNIAELRKVFGWSKAPILDIPSLYDYDYIEDTNERRIRDGEVLGTIFSNCNPKIGLEIGTAQGHSTALMAINAPQATIYTVNIPPEGIKSGKGGERTTIALERDQIGAYYRQRGLSNVIQILANTAYWEPDFGPIDIAFIDGCHDADFVFNDTRKILKQMRAGSFIVWHDFNLDLVKKYDWIGSVCQGVERLYTHGLLSGRILHVRDSWMGMYRIS
jgi:predicted O-methyltransferase YrrM